MRRQTDAITALEARGIFLQDHPTQVALDFVQAAEAFSIRGLP